MISLRAHNILDYLLGVIFLMCPSVFGFTDIALARGLFYICGFSLIGSSLITRYRYSLVQVLPMGVHLVLDVAIGIMLIVSPTLFNYRDSITATAYVVHWAAGLSIVALVMLTTPRELAPSVLEKDTALQEEISRRAA